MSHLKVFSTIVCIFLINGCGWETNTLGLGGKNKNSGDYNTTEGIPPTTPFNVSIKKGELSGPCSKEQLELFSDTEIC